MLAKIEKKTSVATSEKVAIDHKLLLNASRDRSRVTARTVVDTRYNSRVTTHALQLTRYNSRVIKVRDSQLGEP